MVQGELCMSSWEKEGKNFTKYFIRGKDMQFLSSKKSEAKSGDETEGDSDSGSDDIPF